MKYVGLAWLLCIGSIASAQSDGPTQVRRLIEEQVSAWNRGDLEGFMAGYHRSNDLTFYTGGTLTLGWKQTLDSYRERYKEDGREMGKLDFSELVVQPLGDGAIVARGKWQLALTTGKQGGLFTLILKRLPDGWRIVHDHTSAADTANPRIVDLTHTLDKNVPLYPGTARFVATHSSEYATGYYAQEFEMGEHTGTHLDAPAHFVDGSSTVDAIAPRSLRAPAVVIDVRVQVKRSSDFRLSVLDLLTYERAYGRIPDGAVILLRTGWDDRWSDEHRYLNRDGRNTMHFPGFSLAAIDWLLKERPTFVGIGIDTLSTDYGAATDFVVHKRLHGANKYGIENLANLGTLPVRGATLWIAPLKIRGGSGAPARVFAEVP